MAILWTPKVQKALNTAIINRFVGGAAAATSRISGLLEICGARTSDSENLVTLILGKNFGLHRRGRNSDEATKRKVTIHEQRAQLGNYVDFLTIDRMDAIYDKIDRILATSETAGAEVAEAPTRMVEALVPTALGIKGYDGVPFFSTAHPIKGAAGTWANLKNYGALTFDSFDEAEKDFAKIPDEDGHAAGSRVRTLAVGPGQKARAREIVLNARPKEYSGGDNPRAGDDIKLTIVPDWDDEIWAMFDDTLDNDRPFYFVEGRPVRVKPLYIDPEGAFEILNNQLIWAVDGDMAVTLGNPRRALLSANPANAATIIKKYSKLYELNDFGFDLS